MNHTVALAKKTIFIVSYILAGSFALSVIPLAILLWVLSSYAGQLDATHDIGLVSLFFGPILGLILGFPSAVIAVVALIKKRLFFKMKSFPAIGLALFDGGFLWFACIVFSMPIHFANEAITGMSLSGKADKFLSLSLMSFWFLLTCLCSCCQYIPYVD